MPPYVATDLMGGAEEICVERVHPLRFAERNGAYDATFKGLNDAMAGGH